MNLESVIEELFRRAKEKNADEKTVWAVVSMLRGPDHETQDSYYLKMLTVARLRHVIGLHSLLLDTNAAALSGIDLTERDRLLSEASMHFVDHWAKAVSAVKLLYGYDLTYERKTEESPKKPVKKPAKKRPRSKKKRKL
jgi:hypothetical protein